ncbi:MAG: selenide, water dikinase SelD [Planctomycetes bacterium]|nr:selenide, water dikinase SelD [Planctomycetota bacterium]
MSPEDLGQVLSKLTIPTRDDVILGPENLDDAGVVRLDADRALVQTIDFFPPIVDDPYDYGRIAAANALSDVYAMGGTPLSVMNVVGFPRRKLDMSILGDILAGGSAMIAKAGAALLGGHSVEDEEIKYGLAVTGLIHPDHVRANGDARPGDILVLTKPLGMGAVTTSIQKGKEDEEQVRLAVESMATLNDGAARATEGLDVSAVTDITGFGLLGHGSEVARASRVTLVFDAESLPLTLGSRELAMKGCLSGGAARSRHYLGPRAGIEPSVPPELASLAFDAETSGGLLIAVAEKDVDTLIRQLEREQTPARAIVGRVEKEDPTTWVRLR